MRKSIEQIIDELLDEEQAIELLEVFDRAVKNPHILLSFSDALEFLKKGYKIKRKNWGGYWFIPKSTYIKEEQREFTFTTPLNQMIVAKLKDNGGFVPATPYQEDMLAEDWEVIE